MSKKTRRKNQKSTNAASQKRAAFFLTSDDAYKVLCGNGYRKLSESPEIIAGCRRIAELISGMTIHLMNNTDKGDERIVNELSRKIDIDPMSTMTRKHWMDAIVMNLLLYGQGNSIVLPHTSRGYLESLEPIADYRVSLISTDTINYSVLIDGKAYRPDEVLHFVFNPDETYLWKGQGLKVALKDLADNLKQAAETEKAFMQSKWKPSLIIKIDALIDEFASPEARSRLLKEYIETSNSGEPWMIPANEMSVQEVRPLSLSDLAINDTVTLDKKAVAAILGVPAFVLGVGEFNHSEWNNFINNTIRPICKEIEQELTRKILINPYWYFKFNMFSLYAYDIKTISSVFSELYVKGIVTGNEVRDRLSMPPKDGLDELVILENYIPSDMIGQQNKLHGEGE